MTSLSTRFFGQPRLTNPTRTGPWATGSASRVGLLGAIGSRSRTDSFTSFILQSYGRTISLPDNQMPAWRNRQQVAAMPLTRGVERASL